METIQKAPKKRLLSLDVLRGLTVAGMILVNNGGGKEIFSPLQHSEWNGVSLADLVFPLFLFMVGISTYISLRKFKFQWSVPLAKKILKRTCIILIIGWGIYWFEFCCKGNFLPFDQLRIPGVLHRIAISYCIVAVLAVSINHKWFPWVAGALLVVYAFILWLGNGYAMNSTNILSVVDRYVFGEAHLYHKSPIDPEGLLGVIPSVAHTMIGFCFGKIMMSEKNLKDKMLQLFQVGFIIMMSGLLFSYILPMNKRIWSPTFVLFTCGFAGCLQSWLLDVIDERGHKRWTPFFESFGVNPLFLYVFSELLAIVFDVYGIKKILYNSINTVITNGYFASLVYAVLFVVLCWAVGYPLYKKRIYIKI
jgi:predicted acyltransferase